MRARSGSSSVPRCIGYSLFDGRTRGAGARGAGVENAGVSGAGGRFTAAWGAGAVENTAAGAGRVVAETGADVPAPLKATGAAGVFGLGAACCAAAGCENPAGGTGPAG